MTAAATAALPMGASPAIAAGRAEAVSFEAIYDSYFDFVWRSVRRLGCPDAVVDDAVQDVFVVVHRRLASFEGRSTLRTWLFSIALRVVKDYRRTRQRKPTEPLGDRPLMAGAPGPDEEAARAEAANVLAALLDELDDDKRAVFVLAEIEQMPAPEIAEAVGAPVNTVYSRLRLARAAFNDAAARHRDAEARRARSFAEGGALVTRARGVR